ncbi:hypothetical protein ACFYT3_30660 [Nocardia amikacinitolerans]|uniref:hypothetical protein n=1 Tax=Nocardia amikacinitolerans TaxID=756689 RepID=UPI0036C8C04B
MASFADCLTDPGELGTEDVIVAVSSHHACSPPYRVLDRALDTLDAEYVWPPSTAAPEPFQASQQLRELNQHLANRPGEYHQLAQRQEER